MMCGNLCLDALFRKCRSLLLSGIREVMRVYCILVKVTHCCSFINKIVIDKLYKIQSTFNFTIQTLLAVYRSVRCCDPISPYCNLLQCLPLKLLLQYIIIIIILCDCVVSVNLYMYDLCWFSSHKSTGVTDQALLIHCSAKTSLTIWHVLSITVLCVRIFGAGQRLSSFHLLCNLFGIMPILYSIIGVI